MLARQLGLLKGDVVGMHGAVALAAMIGFGTKGGIICCDKYKIVG